MFQLAIHSSILQDTHARIDAYKPTTAELQERAKKAAATREKNQKLKAERKEKIESRPLTKRQKAVQEK
jgi:hypothetical protein